MAYVRKLGNQLALVHGQRDPITKRVGQRILFLIYSQAEARAMLGSRRREFRNLLMKQHANLSFPWTRIENAIREHICDLPPVYADRQVDRTRALRSAMTDLLKQLMPDDRYTHQLLNSEKFALEFVAEVIKVRIAGSTGASDRLPTDDFHWRYALEGHAIHWDVEEMADGCLERGELDRAEAAFRLLVECSPQHADGYNALGAIAEDRGRHPEAITLYEKAVALGRNQLPKRVGRGRWWSDLETRPFMRALRNLAAAFNRAGRYEEALVACERLERECGDDAAARLFRASVFLNQSRWGEAAEEAEAVSGLWPEEKIVAAFAYAELGRKRDAVRSLLHAALNQPRAVATVLGRRTAAPKAYDESRDHNTGVEALHSLSGYLGSAPQRPAIRFLRRVIRDRRVCALLAEAEKQRKARDAKESIRDRNRYTAIFHRLREIQSPEFARQQADVLADLWADPQ